MKVYKAVTPYGGRLYSWGVIREPGGGGGNAYIGDGELSLLYEPGVATKPTIAGSGLYAFTDAEAAEALACSKEGMAEIWEADADFLGWISHPCAGYGLGTYVPYQFVFPIRVFWERTPLHVSGSPQPGSKSACLCSSITLSRRIR